MEFSLQFANFVSQLRIEKGKQSESCLIEIGKGQREKVKGASPACKELFRKERCVFSLSYYQL